MLPSLSASRRRGNGLVLFGAVCFATGCEAPAVPVVELKSPEVETRTPVVRTLREKYETTGRIAARHRVEVRPRVSGYLEEAPFDDGAEVKAGDVLFRIDKKPLQAEKDQAAAEVAKAAAAVEKAEADYIREKELFDRKATSKANFDHARAERDYMVAAAAAARAKADAAQINLDFATLTAPIDGRLSATRVKPGNLVGPSSLPDEYLTSIVSISPVQVYFNMDERTLLRVRETILARKEPLDAARIRERNIRVEVLLENPSLGPLEGTIDFLDNQVDAATGMIRVRAEVDNESRLLDPGMFVRVNLPLAPHEDALLVPEPAIGASLGQKFLYIVDSESRARRRTVKLGLLENGMREILPVGDAPALRPTDRVIVSGLQRVRESQQVTLVGAEGSSPEAGEGRRPEKNDGG